MRREEGPERWPSVGHDISGSSRDHRILGNISDTPQLREREFLKEGAEFQDWVTRKWSRLGGKEGVKTVKMLRFECQFCVILDLFTQNSAKTPLAVTF